MQLSSMQLSSKIFVAGHRGLAGSAILRLLQDRGFTNLLTRTRSELDLTSQAAVEEFFRQEKPEYVFLAAAKVGGILANKTRPAEFIRDNLFIQTNVIDSAARFEARKLLFLGSSCIYPKFAAQPIKEEYLLTGSLEPTNDAYAIAKISGIMMGQSYRRQYGFNAIAAQPTNLYGPGDNFDLNNSHVLPALIRKFHEAKNAHAPTVVIWGSGSPLREFLHVDDLASACIFLMQNYDEEAPMNVGTGEDLTIADLARLVQKVTGFEGTLEFDASKPDGTPRKLLDVSRLTSLGWKATIPLEEGIRQTYQWFLETHRAKAAMRE